METKKNGCIVGMSLLMKYEIKGHTDDMMIYRNVKRLNERRRKMRLLVFSTNEYFVEAFSKLVAKKMYDIELYCYSKEEYLRNQLQNGGTGVILSESGYLQDCVGDYYYVELSTLTIMPKDDKVGKLNIYQKADLIVEDLGHIISIVAGGNATISAYGNKMAFFSTEGGAGKTTIAYLTAVSLAKSKKTLYWNLSPIADTENLYDVNFQNTMEAVLYALHEKSGVLECIFETITCNEDGVYVLPNIKSLGDYISLSPEVINELCEYIFRAEIEVIIMDLPGCYNNFTEKLMYDAKKIVWVHTGSEKGIRYEESIKKDPYLRKLMERSVFVRNKASKKDQENISFPISNTMQKATRISKVLEVNPEFASGCKEIEKQIL